MTQWLIDTFIWTGLLIALVLVLRRPVSRHFGPQVAYALWALPLVRFVMPPVVLPASFAPAEPALVAEPLMIFVADAPIAEAASNAAIDAPQTGFALTDLLLPLWLGGAAIFLAWRARDYLHMRRQLLAEARPVGEAGKVRLVETPAVASPIAFGIGDMVVALPPLFMAHHDLRARDLAILHELEHHRAHDLVANLAAQPLLALHWFNPLAWWGWRAMRRDQEAACDARVVAGREWSERAAYAQVIAGFAAGPNLALAAPMACPVLGEKSIIHRLRSLTMTEVTSGRKRLGIAAIATTALAALPLTASISYAQADAPEAPEAPAAPAAPVAPAAPAAPAAPEAFAAPNVPAAPRAPEAPSIESVDPDSTYRSIRIERTSDTPFDRAEMEQMRAEIERDLAEVRYQIPDMDGVQEAIEMALVEVTRAMEHSQGAIALAKQNVPEIEMRCDGDRVAEDRVLDDGRRVIMICEREVQRQAAIGLRQARSLIAQSRDMNAAERNQTIKEIDAEIRRLERDEVSAAPRTSIRIETSASNVAPAASASATAIRVSSLAPMPAAAMKFRAAFAMDDPDCPTGRTADAVSAWANSV